MVKEAMVYMAAGFMRHRVPRIYMLKSTILFGDLNNSWIIRTCDAPVLRTEELPFPFNNGIWEKKGAHLILVC